MNITWSTYFIDEAAKNERNLSCGYENTFAIKKNVFIRGVWYTILAALLFITSDTSKSLSNN